MNEQIEELFTKAKQEQQLYGTNPYEKFAELIVKEFLSKVNKAGFNFNEQPQYNDKQNALVSEGFFWALESVKQQVKEHFGVEE